METNVASQLSAGTENIAQKLNNLSQSFRGFTQSVAALRKCFTSYVR